MADISNNKQLQRVSELGGIVTFLRKHAICHNSDILIIFRVLHTISAAERPQTYALDRAVAGTHIYVYPIYKYKTLYTYKFINSAVSKIGYRPLGFG